MPATMNSVNLLMILFVTLCGSSVPDTLGGSQIHLEYKDKLYYLETYYKASFFKAFLDCSEMNMTLLSIDSDEEFDEIHTIVKDKLEYKEDLMIWTSGAAKETKQFYWMTTGNPVRLSKWQPGEPNNLNGREHCLHIRLKENRFLLNDSNCDRQSYFVCETKKVKC